MHAIIILEHLKHKNEKMPNYELKINKELTVLLELANHS